MRKIILIGLLGLFQWGLGQGVWTKAIEYDGTDMGIYDVIKLSDGTFIACGSVSTSIYGRDMFFINFEETGNVLSDTLIVDGGNAMSIKTTSDGGYIVAGVRNSSENKDNQMLLKINSAFEEEWVIILDSASGYDQLRSVAILSDGNYMGTGNFGTILSAMVATPSGDLVWSTQYEQAKAYDIVPAWDGGG